MTVEFTRKKYLEVWIDGQYVSRHTSLGECLEAASNHAAGLPVDNKEDLLAEHTYNIQVGSEVFYEVTIKHLINEQLSKLQVAPNVGPPNNNPPSWTSQPSPSFVQGVASNYSLADLVTDADGDTVDITLNTGTVSLPSGVTYNTTLDRLEYDGIGAVATTSGHIATASDGTDNTDSSSFSIGIQTSSAYLNGWAMQGGYAISDVANQFVNAQDREWNAEKDMIISQMLGWYPGIVETWTGYMKNLYDDNPNILIYPYISPNVMTKTNTGNASGPDFTHDLVTGSNGHEDWILDAADPGYSGYAQSAFVDDNYRTNICDQFTSNNSSGRSFSEQYAYEVYTEMNVNGANGRMIDIVDGVYYDVIPPAPEVMYQDGVGDGPTRVPATPDWDDDNSGDARNDETIPTPTTNEAGYGGARMWRRGMANWVDTWQAQFGSDFVMLRNGSRDGLDYSGTNILGNGDPMDQSEFYQHWGGSIFETFTNGLGIKPNNTSDSYPITANGFAQQARHAARIKLSFEPAGSHPHGKYGANALVMDARLVFRTPTSDDYDFARACGAFTALVGGCLGVTRGTRWPFPPLDEYVYDWGDTVNPHVGTDGDPHSLGTINPTISPGGSNADFTLRSADYTGGGGTFYWCEFDNVLWVMRSDWTAAANRTFPYGTTADCQLPNPGTGKKWIHPNLSSYTNPNTGFSTRNQNATLNDGSDVAAGGSYGIVSLLPAHGVMVARADV